MYKKIISSALALSMLAGTAVFVPETGVSAQASFLAQTVSKATSGKCGKNVSWSLDKNGTLTLSGSGKTYDCTYDDPSPFRCDGRIKKVIVKKGVTSIGDSLFDQCYSLESAELEEGVISIGENAFIFNILKSISLPDSLETIGSHAFERAQFTSIKLPKNLKSIGSGAFVWCDSIKSVELPKGLKTLRSYTFAKCSSLESVTIPDSVTTIESGAFEFCKFKTLTIPDSVTKIDMMAIVNCHELESIIIPPSVKTIGEDAVAASDKVVIICAPGSAAEKFAKGNSLKYKYSVAFAKASLSKSAYKYTGKKITPAVTVKLSGKTLKKNKDYTLSFKNNKNCGKATVTVTGKGDYKGKLTKTFVIKPGKAKISKLTSPKTKQLKVKIKKSQGGVTGYQIAYSSSKKFAASKTKTISVKTTGKTIKGLKKGKTCYVKVRAYKTVGGKKYYGAYSGVKKISVK
ncbi:MAG: leucine-rich repeat domain-containing protein [Ruminococcus sp.]|nr:leucine-rich repeat domain-containing protein [Ruminococcus sp.]